jgi:SAM-dependent methyltransferase
MWNARYSRPGFVYGTEPNDFLVSEASRIPPGRVLSLGEGEGRNAVYLAGLGYDVFAVDGSPVGLRKARQLAAQRGVDIRAVAADLSNFELAPLAWEGIISIFCHLPPQVRRHVHRQVVRGLRPGGVFILEAYTPKQLDFGTGGPPTADLLLSLDDLRLELVGLELLVAREMERQVLEGSHHTGRGHVVQVVARAVPRPGSQCGPEGASNP